MITLAEEGMIYIHTWCPVDGETLDFPVILYSNATQWLILALRQHKTKSNLIRADETSEKNLFWSKRTVTADSPIWFGVPVWLMCWWRHKLKNKCKVTDNYHVCWKQNYSLFINHGFLHCFWMTGLKAWLISFLFSSILHNCSHTDKKRAECSREYWFVTHETVQSHRPRPRRGIESNFSFFSGDVII